MPGAAKLGRQRCAGAPWAVIGMGPRVLELMEPKEGFEPSTAKKSATDARHPEKGARGQPRGTVPRHAADPRPGYRGD
jgi:hypothetical protein